MIEYLEIRNADLNVIGIIDTASSIIWRTVYYGVGDFEIYTKATPQAFKLLKKDRYVTRLGSSEFGIIEHIEVIDNQQDGKMIIASGRFGKSILDRRHIYQLSGNSNTATILRGNVETEVRRVISDNAISCSFDSKRNIPNLKLGNLASISKRIVDENGNATQKQVSFDNLLEYTDKILQEYEIGSYVKFDFLTKKLLYTCYEGIDRSTVNKSGNKPIIFSREYDNLTDSSYIFDNSTEKTAALIGGEGEGVERYYEMLETSAEGLARRETWIDASGITKTYKDAGGTEQTYSDEEYSGMLKAQGSQALSEMRITENFSGTIDTSNGNFVFNRDFRLGDIVTVQDKDIGKYIHVRIIEATEVQDGNGYAVTVKYAS